MNVFTFFDVRAKRLGIVGVKLAQAAAFFFALVIAKLVPEVLSVSVWWFVGLALLCAVKPALDFFAPASGTTE